MISVIVPVYKVEKYLDKSVQSILAQTYEDFELILVDDGSPDKCPQMCDDYAQRDKRVKVVHKENGGLSDARNAGASIANGDYVTFIDSDDYVSSDYLEHLWILKEKYDADISITGIKVFYDGENHVNTVNKGDKYEEYCYSGVKALEAMLYQDNIDSSACAMLIPIAVVRNNPFPKGKYHEDEFTTYKYYIAVNRVAISTKNQYFYYQRRDSIMYTLGQPSIDELDAADNYVKVCEELYPNFVKAAKSKKFSDYCQVLLKHHGLKDNNNVYTRIISYIGAEKLAIIMDKRTRLKNKVAAISLFVGPRGLLTLGQLRNFIHKIHYRLLKVIE